MLEHTMLFFHCGRWLSQRLQYFLLMETLIGFRVLGEIEEEEEGESLLSTRRPDRDNGLWSTG